MRSPSFATRTSGPVSVTSPHESRFGAGIAVAGINKPPEVRRSPFSGTRTTIRSPVRRISGAVADFLLRDACVRAAGFGELFGSSASSFRVGTHGVYEADPVA